jgi:hypothetical protein
MGRLNRLFLRFREAVRFFIEQKQWWLTPLFVVLIALLLLIMRLIKYQHTEFIYSLF